MAVGKWQSFIPYRWDLKIRCQVSGVRREERKSGNPNLRMKLQIFGTVGRATVPTDTGRHGGRPYDSTKLKFVIRLDWPLFRPAAGLTPDT